ncbi:DNA photolyase family protein [Flavobacteriaceae bacterium S0825]|uniref:cryptochrome/photolyase family protein n=1 Tax=Gaetbulibacter sp. S0825 TaxID=2720084 RepID=UPI00143125BA|nr:deoxyribodipyrimidine photo-lyase [Gaetbulibacter sp. S0825]MCK0109392.1 DNA photolyase family protein [Flavobacteriaceae bacterium S0825]NIX65026.1 deoxyribodipyrimidine photo-lyase [Gaetbulibacter sp. S0825]
MKDTINIFWFRRDLRLEDNVGLFHALNAKYNVLPIFIFDKDILESLPKNDARVTFIHKTLSDINDTLKEKFESSLATFHNKPLEVFKQLATNYVINTVFTNHDYEPYAKRRDNDVKAFLETKNIDFKSYKDQVIFETNEVVKDDGTSYKVYTPYSKKWIETLQNNFIKNYNSEENLSRLVMASNLPFLSLSDIGFVKSNQTIESFDASDSIINNYEATRNFPAKEGTSKLGPHLRFGTVSARKMVQKALKSHNNTFLKELIWREFFMQILWHFPHTITKSFKPQYDAIQWRNDKEEFKAWCEGKTGYPLVDAGMRELNETGFMHNRVRMLVGSFLCKHLLIDWRLGEAYFAEKLHDYELASNVGNWQWVAGCGVDAAPYFRIFNPTTQIQKFDKDHTYIKQWVPEYQELTYTQPIVEHKFARERCLKTYKEALDQF